MGDEQRAPEGEGRPSRRRLALLATLLVVSAVALPVLLLFAFPPASASPSVTGFAEGSETSDVTSHVVTIPGTQQEGDLLFVVLRTANTGTFTLPSGWTAFTACASDTECLMAKVSNSSEPSTVTVTTNLAFHSAWQSFRVANADTVAGNFTSAADPPALNLTAPQHEFGIGGANGSRDALWVPLYMAIPSSTVDPTCTAAPSSYGSLQNTQSGDAGNDHVVCSSRRSLVAVEEDPGTYTTGGTPTNEEVETVAFWMESPTVVTLPADVTGPTSAVLNGNLTDLGGASEVNVSFEWGDTPSLGNQTANQTRTSTGEFNETLSSLSPGTTHFFRARADAPSGTVFGANLSFTTTSPVVETDPATDVIATRAVLNGNLTDTGGQAWVNTSFEWGDTPSLGNFTASAGNFSSTTTFNLTLTALQPNVTYFFQARGVSPVATVNGTTLSFTTPPVNETAWYLRSTSPLGLNLTFCEFGATFFELELNRSAGPVRTQSPIDPLAVGLCWVSPVLDEEIPGGDWNLTVNLWKVSPTIDGFVNASFNLINATGVLLETVFFEANRTIDVTDDANNESFVALGVGNKTLGEPYRILVNLSSPFLSPFPQETVLLGYDSSPGTVGDSRLILPAPPPPPPPALVTLPATNVSAAPPAQTADLNLNLTDLGSATFVTVSFRIGTSPDDLIGFWPAFPPTLTSPQTFLATADGLAWNTTYFFRARGVWDNGTAWGAILNFTTASPALPTVLTLPATDVTFTTAGIHGEVLTMGDFSSLLAEWQWGTHPTLLTGTALTPSFTVVVPATYSETLSGLTAGVTYFFQFQVGRTQGFLEEGAILSFTTLRATVVTLPATGVTPTYATLRGDVTLGPGIPSIDAFFEWGDTPSLGNVTPSATVGAGTFEAQVMGLDPSTTYFFRAVVDGGISVGSNLTFTTAAAPPEPARWWLRVAGVGQDVCLNGADMSLEPTEGAANVSLPMGNLTAFPDATHCWWTDVFVGVGGTSFVGPSTWSVSLWLVTNGSQSVRLQIWVADGATFDLETVLLDRTVTVDTGNLARFVQVSRSVSTVTVEGNRLLLAVTVLSGGSVTVQFGNATGTEWDSRIATGVVEVGVPPPPPDPNLEWVRTFGPAWVVFLVVVAFVVFILLALWRGARQRPGRP